MAEEGSSSDASSRAAMEVLLDTVLVRSLLVPALAYDIGPRIWWPGKLGRPELNAAEPGEPASRHALI